MPTPSAVQAFTELFAGDLRVASLRFRHLMWDDSVAGLLNGYGWNDGGCVLLADAVDLLAVKLEHRQVALVIKGSELVQHALNEVTARGRRWYVDADGICSKRALLHRWTTVELLREPVIVNLSDAVIGEGTPRSRSFSEQLAALIGAILSA